MCPQPKPPWESVKGAGGRRQAKTWRKRGQESTENWARGIQRAVSAAFHEATAHRQRHKMERSEAAEPEREGQEAAGGRRALRRPSSPTRRRGRGEEGRGRPVLSPRTRGPRPTARPSAAGSARPPPPTMGSEAASREEPATAARRRAVALRAPRRP